MRTAQNSRNGLDRFRPLSVADAYRKCADTGGGNAGH